MTRRFLDTNIFVYADDLDAGDKADIAQGLIDDAFARRSAVISTQVLQEFFAVTTRKLGVDAAVARRKVELLARLDVVTVNLELILGAIDLHRLYSISFWDALVVKAAAVSGCTSLLTEDLQTGQMIDGVRVENPFVGCA